MSSYLKPSSGRRGYGEEAMLTQREISSLQHYGVVGGRSVDADGMPHGLPGRRQAAPDAPPYLL